MDRVEIDAYDYYYAKHKFGGLKHLTFTVETILTNTIFFARVSLTLTG